MVAYGRLKTKENFKLLALKVVVGTYKRFQIYSSDLTWKLLVFWKTGSGGQVVATRVSTVFQNAVIFQV